MIYVILLLPYLIIFRINHLYSKRVFLASVEQIVQIVKAVFSLFVIYVLASFLFKWPLIKHNRSLLLMFIIFSLLFLIAGRLGFFKAVYKLLTKDGFFKRRIIIIGAGKGGTDFLTSLRQNPSFHAEVLCFFDDDPQKRGKKILGVPVLGSTKELDFYLRTLRIPVDGIYICKNSMGYERLLELIGECKKSSAPVYVNSEQFEVIADMVNVEEFEDFSSPVIYSSNKFYREFFKPMIDFFISFTSLFFLLPFFPPVALAIKLTSKGPVFYKRKAFGKERRSFTQYKLRTMKNNSGQELHRDFMKEMIAGKKKSGDFKMKRDPRVTSVGKILRKLSLDELPQLYNILKGDMSLIGPRPSLEYEYQMQRIWHKQRYSILPGLSGLWQAFGRSSVNYDDMVIMDIYYDENLSFWLDFKIFFQTIPNILMGRGAY